MENFNLFDTQKTPLKIDKPIRLIELFAGIGSQAKALKRLSADFEHYRVCELDKYAIKSYNAIHGTNFVTSDITQLTADDLGVLETDKYCYIMTYSFPCQDLSLAGKQKGMAKGENTRSGLLWEVERLLNECNELPQILLMENVTQVHGKKNKDHFEEWIAFLESKGYSNYWQDLNAKNFGIPQNRNRTFMVSVLGNYTYQFPQEFPLKLRLKDMLEDSVDEKFYLSDAMINYCIGVGQKGGKFPRKERFLQNLNRENINIGNAITTNEGNRPVSNFIFGDCEKLNDYIEDYTDDEKLLKILNGSTTPTDAHCDHKRNVDLTEPFIVASRGRNPENPSDRTAGIHLEQRLEPNFSGCTNTLTTVQKDNYVANGMRIRKLTPKECWRLMGFDDTDFEKAAAVNSNSQLYKQAGNSIVVDVLCYIFEAML